MHMALESGCDESKEKKNVNEKIQVEERQKGQGSLAVICTIGHTLDFWYIANHILFLS